MKKPMLSCFVLVTGVKKRCRKTERHHLDLGKFEPGTDRNTLKELARAKVSEEMKAFEPGATLHVNHCEIENEGGFGIISANLFDPRNERHALDVATATAGAQ